MNDKNRLQNMILLHWRTHQPQMVAELERKDMLPSAVAQAESRASDLLYQLLSVDKMQYQEALKIALKDCLSPTSKKTPAPPAISVFHARSLIEGSRPVNTPEFRGRHD
jgi:hypothetical protein